MYSILASASVGSVPFVLRLPACSDPCAVSVVSRLSEPVPAANGGLRAAHRSPGVRTLPAEADGACEVCGREVIARHRGTLLQRMDASAVEEAWV